LGGKKLRGRKMSILSNFRDPLQKRFREMEVAEASPSLATQRPTLQEKVYFLRRALSKGVDHVKNVYTIVNAYATIRENVCDWKDVSGIFGLLGTPIEIHGDLLDEKVAVTLKGETFDTRVGEDHGCVSLTRTDRLLFTYCINKVPSNTKVDQQRLMENYYR
jgi:hypothetical protein